MPEIRSIEFAAPPSDIDSASDDVGIRVKLGDGSSSAFSVATPDRPAAWVKERREGFAFGGPVLFVRRIAQELVGEAVVLMGREMGGFWLRYYNARPGTDGQDKPARVATIAVAGQEPAASGDCSAVVEVALRDGRVFSILAATPSWLDRTLLDLGLRFYFGPSILFVKEMTPALVRRAVKEMAAQGDALLCRHDTPRTTLKKILADFKSAHP